MTTHGGASSAGVVPSAARPEYALKLSEAEIARYAFMAQSAARVERDLWDAAGVVEGAVVADVGCGPGAISMILAEQVGPSGRVFAVDRDASAVDAARSVVARAGMTTVTVDVGDAHDTGIAPGSVDVVMIRHVLAHNGGREEAIVAHAASLVRPGGHVYLVDIDATGIRNRGLDADIEDLNSRYWQWHRQCGNDISVGLRLHELLEAAGLDLVDHQGRYQILPAPPGFRPPSWAGRDALEQAGLATPGDVDRWASALERTDALEHRPRMFIPMFFAIGRRPGP